MTRNGQLQAFKPDLMAIARGTQAPLIPVYLDELAGSIFSYRGGKSAWWWPGQWPIPVSIWFGPRIPDPGDIHQVRQAVQDLGAEAVQGRATRSMTPPRAMLRSCRAALFRKKVADSTGVELTGGGLVVDNGGAAAIEVVEAPSPSNNWSRFSFRATGKALSAVVVEWKLAPSVRR